MAFALVARFPLGTYRGHRGGHDIDTLPDPARLHAALLAAAAAGPRGRLDERGIAVPDDEDRRALEWLEENPPDGLVVPASHVGGRQGHWRYRKTGTIPQEGVGAGKRWKWKTLRDRPESLVALAGEVAWTWSEAPPGEVARALVALAPDVSHLGTAESPTVLFVAEREPTHERDNAASPWDPPEVEMAVATPGRTEILIRAHRDLMCSPVRDGRHSGSDEVTPPPRPEGGLRPARYRPRDPEGTHPLPWDLALLRRLCLPVPVDRRVAAAVAIHRALVAVIGDGAPPLVTGHFAEGLARPANRVAVQIMDKGMPSRHVRGACATVALMIPRGAEPAEVEMVWEAFDRIRAAGRANEFTEGSSMSVRTDDFWDPLTDEPLWATAVPAVPDARPPRGIPWSMDDTVCLSVGLVWRDILGLGPAGARWAVPIAAAARAAGAVTYRAARLRCSDAWRYVHRMNPHAVAMPYEAVLGLGRRLAPSTALTAIGQSRHLGGGLLIPVAETLHDA